MTKHIELFDGSRLNLEDMTGKTYQALKTDEGKLVKVETRLAKRLNRLPESIEEAKKSLRSQALELGADALVHVTYATEPKNFANFKAEVYASGYAVKEKRFVGIIDYF